MNEFRNFLSSIPASLLRILILDLLKAMKHRKRLGWHGSLMDASPYLLGTHHEHLFDEARQLIEKIWQTRLEQVDEDIWLKIIFEFRKAYWQRLKTEEGFKNKEEARDSVLDTLWEISPPLSKLKI